MIAKNMIIRKVYLLAGVIMAFNMFVANEVKAMNMNKDEGEYKIKDGRWCWFKKDNNFSDKNNNRKSQLKIQLKIKKSLDFERKEDKKEKKEVKVEEKKDDKKEEKKEEKVKDEENEYKDVSPKKTDKRGNFRKRRN